MVLIGCSKRAVVDDQARRFGNKRHTGTFPFKENIKAKALVPLERKRFKSIPQGRWSVLGSQGPMHLMEEVSVVGV